MFWENLTKCTFFGVIDKVLQILCNKTAKTGTQYISPRTKPAPPFFIFHVFYATTAAIRLPFFKNKGCFCSKPGSKPLC